MDITNLRMSDIARRLKSHGIPFLDGRQWTNAAVGRTLRNQKYAGVNTWNRMTCKLTQQPEESPSGAINTLPWDYFPLARHSMATNRGGYGDQLREVLSRYRKALFLTTCRTSYCAAVSRFAGIDLRYCTKSAFSSSANPRLKHES